jgi:acetate kinase
MNAAIDKVKNKNAKQCKDPVVDVSAENSGVKIYVIPTDEELVIASKAEMIVKDLM